MAALSSKSQEDHLVVVNSLSLFGEAADGAMRVELLGIKDELSDYHSHYTRRNLFRLRVYQALQDPDAVVFRDADGNPLDLDTAVQAAMERLRHNKVDMMSLLESTRVFLYFAKPYSNDANTQPPMAGRYPCRQDFSLCPCFAGWYKANLTKLVPPSAPESESRVIASKNILQALNVRRHVSKIALVTPKLELSLFKICDALLLCKYLHLHEHQIFYADFPKFCQGKAEAKCAGQGRHTCGQRSWRYF